MNWLRIVVGFTVVAAPAFAQPAPPARPTGAQVDYHVQPKGGLTVEDALRRSRETGIYYGLAINGGLGQPAETDAALEAFLRELDGKPVYKAMQAEGREWVRMFSKATLEKFDYVFTDSMTWTDSGRRMRLWIPEEVGTIRDPEAFMDERHLGYNPIGGWSVLALLLALAVQAGTGLFANDDVVTEGPLVRLISKDTSDFITRIHNWNELVLYALVGLHLAAIIFYAVVKRENLVVPMVTGHKSVAPGEPVSEPAMRGAWQAAVLPAGCAALVWLVVTKA